jgi:competence protein ComEA
MAEKLIVNINSADIDALQQLPGIGKSIAERIIEGRPYLRVDDLLEIPGVGKARFERIKSHFEIPGIQTLDTELELDKSESLISEDGRDQDLSIERIRQGLEKMSPEPKPPKPKRTLIRKTLSRVETLWLVFGVGFITILLSVITTLVIMGGINNTLDFNRLQSIQDIESNLADLERQLVDLSADLESVDRRVQPLEGLSGRMVSVEEELGSIQGDVGEALFAVGTMQTELDFILTETTRLSERVIRFDNFLEGLEELMRAISNSELVE